MIQPFKPIQLTSNFYQLGTPYFPVYLSMGEQGMLIEGGVSATAQMIVEQIDVLGIVPEKIKYIALTHTHADHIGALPRLKKVWPHLQSIASPLGAKILSNEKMLGPFKDIDNEISEIMKSKLEIEKIPQNLDEYDFSIDIAADENSRFDLGNGICWTVCPIPGHAGCQVAFYEEKEGTLAIGDAIGYHNPQKDLFWPNYFESLKDYIDSIKRLAALNPGRIVLSHNGAIEKDTRGFLLKAMKATEAYHNEMLKRMNNKEDIKVIAKDKAEWVWSFSDHMPKAIVPMLCKFLIKQSLAADKDGSLSFEL